MSESVTAKNLDNTSTQLELASLPQTLEYTGANVTGIIVEFNGRTYKQTITYTGSLVNHISGWEQQP